MRKNTVNEVGMRMTGKAVFYYNADQAFDVSAIFWLVNDDATRQSDLILFYKSAIFCGLQRCYCG